MTNDSGGARRGAAWLVIIGAAVAFYGYGARAGALQPAYTDETSYYTIYAMQLAQRLLLGAPTKFVTVFPSGYSLVLMIVYGGWYSLGRLTGEFSGTTDFLVRYAVHREEFTVLARWVSAAFAAAALPGAYLTARRLFNARVAVIATLALALCYPMVFYAHLATNNTMLICLSAWTLYWIARVWQEGTRRSYLAAGALIGAGIGTKYYPAVWFLSLALAHVYRQRDGGIAVRRMLVTDETWKLVAAGAVAVPVVFLFFPLPLVDPVQWWVGMVSNLVYYTGGNMGANALSYLVGSATVFETTTAEPVSWWSNSFLVLSHTGLAWICAGVAFGLVALRRPTLLLTAPFLLFFAYQSARGGLGLGVRQFFFALPALWIAASAALDEACRRLGLRAVSPAALTIVAASVLLIEPASWAARFLVLSSRPTTVETARLEMAELVPAGSALLVDSAVAPYGETAEWRDAGVQQTDVSGEAADRAREARRRAAPRFDVQELRWKDAPDDLRAAARRGDPVYVALTDYQTTGYWDPETIRVWGNISAPRAEARRAYVRELLARTEIVRVYRPRELKALGPTVTLLRFISTK